MGSKTLLSWRLSACNVITKKHTATTNQTSGARTTSSPHKYMHIHDALCNEFVEPSEIEKGVF